MSRTLDFKLLPWQKEVWEDPARFKVIAAGRRCGKSYQGAMKLLVRALQDTRGETWYIAPTQNQARKIMWKTLLEIGKPVIDSAHINNLEIHLINGQTISLYGADRPDTMRGSGNKYILLDEYADMKPFVWEQVLRPTLTDFEGDADFIGTPKGRNHFYDLYNYADSGVDPEWKAFHFTSFDNPFLKKKEIEAAKRSMSTFAFNQEYMASFEAAASDIFKPEWFKIEEEEPEDGQFYMTVDLAGFEDVQEQQANKKKYLDESAICIAKVSSKGWWIKEIQHGRWDVRETAVRILNAARKNGIKRVGFEKGALKNALMLYLREQMARLNFYVAIEELTHGNKKKTDRIVWSLQGRLEHGRIKFNRGDWNRVLLDQLLQFPDTRTHDDLIDALSYIDQVSNFPIDFVEQDDFETYDDVAGY